MRWQIVSKWQQLQLHKRPSWLFLILRLFSRVYAKLQALDRRCQLFRQRHSSLMVLSLGSPRAGGSGKTPLVRALMSWLQRHTQAVVVCRGYGASKEGSCLEILTQDSGGPDRVGDEPWMLAGFASQATLLPVMVSKSRYNACERAYQLGYQVAVLDDGMQHYRLARDLDLAVVTPEDFEDELLPAGRLREPLEAIARCDWLFIKDYGVLKERDRQRLASYQRPWVGFEMASDHLFEVQWTQDSYRVHPIPWEFYRGKQVLAFAGIAKPESMFALLQKQGLEVVESCSLADHQPIDESWLLDWLKGFEGREIQAIVCTEKDWARLDPKLAKKLPLPILWPSWEVKFNDHADLFFQDLEVRLAKRRLLKKQ